MAAPENRFQRRVHVAICTSTQDLSQADGAGDWAVFSADHQTAGRGRMGRAWHHAAGLDLAATFRLTRVHLRDPARLAAAIPVAIARTLLPVISAVAIKWPNDLLVEGRKVCGVLIDSTGSPPDVHHVGIGINVNRTVFPAELEGTSTSLALATGREFDRGALLAQLAAHIEAAVAHLQAGDLAALAEDFRVRLGLLGRRVSVRASGRKRTGTLTAMDLDALTLDGTERIALAHVQELRRSDP